MKYLILNRKNLLFATLMASAFGVNAQIESTHTDEKYNYTTVVYKDKAATDSDVLSALDNSIGLGDVVRVTVAPPKPAVVPTVDKSKGEDTWLKSDKRATAANMTASTAGAPMTAASGTTVVASKPAPAVAVKPALAVKAAPAINAAPVVKTAAAAPKAVVVQEKNNEENRVAVTPRTVKVRSAASIQAGKSANKSLRKGGKRNTSFKMKSRKAGKQRYKCPTF